ncbi:MAG: 4-hydroxythreonine-4-phosphate dehydrogenase PdxA [Caldimicrobium sp.]
MVSLGITLGDPCGVGPEILIKSLVYLSKLKAKFFVFGDKNYLEDLSKKFFVEIPKNVEIISLSQLKINPGFPTRETHLASIKYLKEAILWAKAGKISGLITLPLNKEAFEVADLPYRGHTEMLAKEFSAKSYAMSFYGKRLKVSLVTTHLPLNKVSENLKLEKIIEVARLSYWFMKRLFPKKKIKMALCGLNPHAGEGGLLGEEEEKILKPALEMAKEEGIPIDGPYPADSLFYWALKGKFDLVIALYHDQGLIPFKMVHFRDGVNVTLGLPIIRTSPVHGTAYDIAGKGLADIGSFLSSVTLTFNLSKKC